MSRTRTMNRIGTICIFLAFSVELNTGSQALTKGLTCVTDYYKTVSCSLKFPVTSSQMHSHWLEFHWNSNITDFPAYDNKHGPYTCSLQGAGEDRTCTFTVNDTMTDFDTVAVTLHYVENGTEKSDLLDDRFHPAKNIKPKPPFNLTLQYINETYYFFWMHGYEDHHYGESLPFEYEFLYLKDGDNDSEQSVHPNDKMIEIHEMRLDPSTTYTAMVRTGITKQAYSGTWSEWSSAVKWSTTYRVQDDPDQVGKIVIGTFLVLGLLILLISVPVARFKMKEMSWMPTPAPYFQPLYQNYQGNFQCWVLAKSPLQSFHVTEDFATIDKVSEVVMTALQDRVEKTGMYPAAHCHQPYVPTAEPWAPCQMPDTCSETSIPCEEFSFFCEGLPDKVDGLMQSLSVACLSGDVLSLKDSVLSLESLEDCEVSEAPIIINPTPMCFKQDYCTLTNTPTGLVPTLTGEIEQDENTFSD